MYGMPWFDAQGADLIRDIEWVIFDEVSGVVCGSSHSPLTSSSWILWSRCTTSTTLTVALFGKKSSSCFQVRACGAISPCSGRSCVTLLCSCIVAEHVSMVFLSATTPNTVEFSEWIGRTKQRPVHVISTLKRPVPLKHHVYLEGDLYAVRSLCVVAGVVLPALCDAPRVCVVPPVVGQQRKVHATIIQRGGQGVQGQGRQKIRWP